jgi:hypothetical protein
LKAEIDSSDVTKERSRIRVYGSALCGSALSIYDICAVPRMMQSAPRSSSPLPRFVMCAISLPRKNIESASLPTIGKPRDGDNKTPCHIMLAKNQKQNKHRTVRACKFAHASSRGFFTDCHPRMVILKWATQSGSSPVSRTNAQLWSTVGSREELLPNGCTLIHGAAVAGRLRAGWGATLHVARRGL